MKLLEKLLDILYVVSFRPNIQYNIRREFQSYLIGYVARFLVWQTLKQGPLLCNIF